MFNCVNPHNQLAHEGQDDETFHSGDSDGLVFDQVISEGIKLKKKCKALKTSMLFLEEEKEKMRLKYEKDLAQKNLEAQQALSTLTTQHLMDMSSLVDGKNIEIQHLKDELHSLHLKLTETEELKTALEDKVYYFTVERENDIKTRGNYVDQLKSDFEQEKEALESRFTCQVKEIEQQLNTLTERNLLLESTVSQKLEIAEQNFMIEKKQLLEKIDEYDIIVAQKNKMIDDYELQVNELSLKSLCVNKLSMDCRRLNELLVKRQEDILKLEDVVRGFESENSVLRECASYNDVADWSLLLNQSKQEIVKLQMSLEELTRSKNAVELAVKLVLEEKKNVEIENSILRRREDVLVQEISELKDLVQQLRVKKSMVVVSTDHIES